MAYRKPAQDPALAEIIGVRLLLVNVRQPTMARETVTAPKFGPWGSTQLIAITGCPPILKLSGNGTKHVLTCFRRTLLDPFLHVFGIESL
jgi:hypothetical protein